MPKTPPRKRKNSKTKNGQSAEMPSPTSLPPVNQSGGVLRPQSPPSHGSSSASAATGGAASNSPRLPTLSGNSNTVSTHNQLAGTSSGQGPVAGKEYQLTALEKSALKRRKSVVNYFAEDVVRKQMETDGQEGPIVDGLENDLYRSTQATASWRRIRNKYPSLQADLDTVLSKRDAIANKVAAINTARNELGYLGSTLHKLDVQELRKLSLEAEEAVSALKKKAKKEEAGPLGELEALAQFDPLVSFTKATEMLETEQKLGKKKRQDPYESYSGSAVRKMGSDLDRLKILLRARRRAAIGEEDDGAVFQEWKRGANIDPNATEQDVLTHFGNNWFRMKDALAFKAQFTNESATDYRIKLGAMDRLLRFRKREVDTLLDETKAAIAQKNDLDPADIVASAVGSVTPTSDYDITFIIKKRPDLEVECVDHFNQTFKQKFGVSSGAMFDTNVYTNGFMTMTPDERAYIDKFNPTNIPDAELSVEEQNIVRAGKVEKHQTQMALSYLAIRQAVSDLRWKLFKDQAIDRVVEKLSSSEGRMADRDLARRDLEEIFKKTEAFYSETESAVQQKKTAVEATKRDDPSFASLSSEDRSLHLEGESKDALYVDSLQRASKYLKSIGDIHRELQDASLGAEDRKQKLKTLKDNIVSFEVEQGKALVFANEAYFSGGAAVHVVKGMQAGGGVELGLQQRMQSLLMNIGYKINHFTHLRGDLPRAFLNTAKYGQRIAHALQEGTGKGGDLTGDLSAEALKLLEADKNLITNVKKSNVLLTTPAKKEAETEKILGERNLSDAWRIRLPYLEIAEKAIADLYANKPGVWSYPPVPKPAASVATSATQEAESGGTVTTDN